ncbi:sad1 unc [Fusarium longipes]|uniref:Sad1 unc n=1 Tax=Fusarium longipes TaxID=694270 RepID=A0A395S587_9HYPO|nr:sad1 unc [Fusarium longipes]
MTRHDTNPHNNHGLSPPPARATRVQRRFNALSTAEITMPSLGTFIWRALAFSSVLIQVGAQSHDPSHTASSPIDLSSTVSTCDARTINYITHTLPQSCLTSSWTSTASSATPSLSNSTSDTSSEPTQSDASSTSVLNESQSQQGSATATSSQDESQDTAGDGATKPFMSFEDWKAMMLRKTGQDPQDLHARNTRPRDRTPPHMGHAGLGEEDEISLNFDSYTDNTGEHKERPPNVDQVKIDGSGKAIVYEDGRASIHRSKDAGKTCKGRFSYSSFDAGATVLKTSPGAKNAKAILVENKDSYMLLECSAKSKFVIVELSDDVLIDTVVVANFEFFSSMFRHFTVSVSDRYPVKMDKWKDIGTFEARNSRDIQPFLVQNPQIFSKYVRIEFLTHWGKEYYCPVSLLRIHGSRMIDFLKEARDDDSSPDEEVEETQQALPSGEEAPTPHETEPTPEPINTTSVERMPYCEINMSHVFMMPLVCPISLDHTTFTASKQNSSVEVTIAGPAPISSEDRERKGPSTQHTPRAERRASDEPTSSASSKVASPSATPAISPTSPSSVSSSNVESVSNSTSQTPSSKITPTSSAPTAPSNAKPSPANTVNVKKGTTGTASGSPASPTVQEGFFKAISKRLTIVETNLTLSLKYLEDQARHMSENLQRIEQKQNSKTNLFHEELNAELRSVREQYEQMWQSTVIALESQREQSNREIVALSSRLNLLADEVVFQKRMAIVQAVLLMACLLLVIFSKGVTLPYLGPLTDQANLAAYDTGSPAARVRALYGDIYSVDEQSAALHAARQGVYVHTDGAADGDNSAEFRHRASLVDEIRNEQAEREQLSPPQTPRSPDGFSSSPDHSPHPRETQSSMLRHAPAIHSGNSRKPLPALPENPASP